MGRADLIMKKGKENTGIWLKCDPTGWVKEIHIVADSDQEQIVMEGILARICRPSVWFWVRRLLKSERKHARF